MEALEYLQMLKMAEPNYEFNRDEFINKFGEEFNQTVNNPKDNIGGIDPKTGHIPYNKFRDIVKAFEIKFKAISELRKSKVGKPLTKKLWAAFYALKVIPLRANLFPEDAERIAQLKVKSAEHKTK